MTIARSQRVSLLLPKGQLASTRTAVRFYINTPGGDHVYLVERILNLKSGSDSMESVEWR